MQPDTNELVMEFEDVFSIKIPDVESARMATVGDALEYIVTKTEVPKNPSVCLFAIAFYSLRGAAMTLGATKRFHPKDSISAILPSSGRHRYWSQLQSTSKLTLPSLRRPGWLVKTCTVVVFACSAVFGFLVYQSTNSELGGFAAALALGLELGLVASLITRPFAVFPDPSCVTLRGLAESAVALNFKALPEGDNADNNNVLWDALHSLIADQHEISQEEAYPTAGLMNDLGCG